VYAPKHFEETDPETLRALIRAHSLGIWVTQSGGELTVNHVPFLLRADAGSPGVLVGHVARANPVWRSLSSTTPSIVVFQGAESYITPSWYPSKHAHGKAVPTWNYAVVHAHGVPRAIDDAEWLLAHLNDLTNTHEAGQALPWKIADAPRDYIDQMIANIVGIEIALTRLEGKWKVSQNRSAADRLGVVAGLTANETPGALEMAALVRERP
jgi:transcriptional regulator